MEKIESISILWRGRKENFEDLSLKVVRSLQYISTLMPDIYSEWYSLGYSLSEALEQKITIDKKNIEDLIEKNKDKKNPSLGTRISLWNGKKEDDVSASFSSTIGLYTNNSNLKNNFVLDLPLENKFNITGLKPLIDFLYNEFQGEILKINGNVVDYPLGS